jgi:hypothetical protein
MAQVDSENNTVMPVVQSRRRFLSQSAGMAAGGAVLALATIPPAPASAAPASPLDPVFGLIAAHRAAGAAHLVALEEQARLEEIGDLGAGGISEGPCHAEMAAFNDLIETAPVTFAGLVAWSSYLDEIEPWMFEERGQTLVVTLVEALGNLAVAS